LKAKNQRKLKKTDKIEMFPTEVEASLALRWGYCPDDTDGLSMIEKVKIDADYILDLANRITQQRTGKFD